MTTSAQAPWHAAYPAPRTTDPGALAKEDVLGMLQRDEQDFVLIDLRRNDHEGGTIRGSINLPAQSLHPTIPRLYKLFKKAGVKKAIWYCGSSGGRGTRAAGWFQDYLDEKGDKDMESVILRGGIKGWATASEEYVKWMDEYDESIWRALKEGKCD
ncbi:oxidoreductase [Apiospora arundinis]